MGLKYVVAVVVLVVEALIIKDKSADGTPVADQTPFRLFLLAVGATVGAAVILGKLQSG